MANQVLRYLGIGKEAYYGVEATPVIFFDIASGSLDSPSEPFITYEGGIGRMPTRVIPGPYVPSGGAEVGADVTRLAYLFALLLGTNVDDDSAVSDVIGESLATASGTLANSPVVLDHANKPIEVYDSLAVLVAQSNSHDIGELDEVGGSGVTGKINAETGEYIIDGWALGMTINYSHGLYKHTITPVEGNTMPSFSAFMGKDVFEHSFLGCVMNQIELSVEQELLMLSLDIQAKIDKKKALRAFKTLGIDLCGGERPKAFHDVQLKAADFGSALSDISAKVRALSLTVTNNATTEENIGLNSRFPTNGTAGALDITGSMTLQFEDTSYKEDFWGHVTEPGNYDSKLKALQININAGAWGNAVINLPRVLLQSVGIQPGGRERLMQEIGFKALYDCSTGEIITVEVNNVNAKYA